MRISNGLYDILKWVTTIVLPAIGTLYFALAQIWGFPYGEEIVGTITALVTFFGVILRISTNTYNTDRADGIIFEDEDTEVDDDEI
jgi:hypothetical protein